MLSRASVEALDRVAALELLSRQLVAALTASGVDVAEMLVAPRSHAEDPGRGEEYVRARVDLASRGLWGEDGLAAALDRKRQERDRQLRADLAVGDRSAEKAAFARAARRIGGRVEADFSVEWPGLFGEARAAKIAEAQRLADLELKGATHVA